MFYCFHCYNCCCNNIIIVVLITYKLNALDSNINDSINHELVWCKCDTEYSMCDTKMFTKHYSLIVFSGKKKKKKKKKKKR